MRYDRPYKGFTIVIFAAWEEHAQSNSYCWHIEVPGAVVPIEGHAYDFLEAYNAACAAIDALKKRDA